MGTRLLQHERNIGLPIGTVRACRAAAAVVLGTLLASLAVLALVGLLGGKPALEQHMWRGKNVEPSFSQTAYGAPPLSIELERPFPDQQSRV
jgi:hypothetical protein